MRKVLLITLLSILFFSVDTFASIYGILQGKVVDSEGKGLVGASVFVEGTNRGMYVKEKDGSYTLVNITAGEYTVKFTFTGMEPVRKQVRISADQTSTLNVTLSSGTVMLKETIITGARLIETDRQGSVNKISRQEIQNTAREGVSGVIGLSAGVIQTGGGFSIRGSRTNETQIRVDGIDVSNQFTGGFGAAGSGYYPMVSSFAVEEIQVLTGGFSAEYGDVSGGLSNSIVQTGRTDRYDGWIRYRTDLAPLWGSQSTGMKVVRENSRLKAIESGEGSQLQSSNEHTFEFGTGGPLPFLKNSTFYLSGSYFYEKNRDNSYEISDPYGNNLGQMPDNRSWVRSITPRLKFALSDQIQLTLGGTYGISSFEFSEWGRLYSNDEGYVYDKMADGTFQLRTNPDGTPVTNGIPERIEKQNVMDQVVSNFFALINHTLTPSSFYEIRIGYSENNDYSARRIGNSDPGFFSKFDVWEPQDNYAVSNGKLVAGHDKIIDDYTPLTSLSFTKDGYARFDLPQRNPLTGYFEGQDNSTGTRNAYGMAGLFNTSGGGSFSFREGSFWSFDGSYTNNFKINNFQHTLKTGLQVTMYDLNRHYNGNPYDGNPFFDVFTDGRFGGNLYADNEVIKEKTTQSKKPTKAALYINDQIKFKGITFSPGLRFDYFNPNSEYRLPSNSFTSIRADTGFGQATAKFQVSPRINVVYPITDQSTLRFNYGMFFQMPNLQYMYNNFNVDVLRGGNILGDPNMDAQRNNMYEIEYNQALTENLLFKATVYYKDIYNQLGVVFIPAVPEPYYQYTVAEYGSSRGLEFELRMPQSRDRNFAFDISYTISKVSGTSANPSSNYNVAIDPYTQKPTFPLAEYVMPQDIPHFLKANAVFYWMDDQGPSVGGIQPLENTTFVLTSMFRSGTPYTRTDRNGRPISEINAERQPSVFTLDAKISKELYLKDIFGDGAGNSRVAFYLDIFNILNRTAAVGVYSATGDPIDDGRTFDRQVGDFVSTSYFKNADISNPTTFGANQYDSYGNRLYNEIADLDKNGIVTQSETYESYFRYVETAIKFRGNFQAPRSVYFSMVFWF
ncbi:MAG TPA: TonB-dependent receptor [Candidatus Kapabacteria bacterium]|nr:TonB-dependent receptor [Candidatus Kapabacteria bacterium]